jgi:hypothetical protein
MKRIFLKIASVSAAPVSAVLLSAAVSAIAAPAPAAAQSRGYGGYDYRYGDAMVERQLDQLRRQLDAGVRSGGISRSEAISLQDELQDIARLEDRYDRSGLSVAERSDLQSRLIRLRDRIAYAQSGRGYGYQDGRSYPGYDPYDRNDPYGADVWDRNGDGWDDRAYDPDGGRYDDGRYDDGRYDDGRYGNGTTYDPYRPGYGGSYDTDPYDDGRYDGGSYGGVPALRVGDRAPASLSAVPPAFRSRYVDGNGVYYRYDNGRVYQIDSRTDVVRWVGQLPY